MTVSFANSAKKALKALANPRYINHRILSEDLAAIFFEKKSHRMNKGNRQLLYIF